MNQIEISRIANALHDLCMVELHLTYQNGGDVCGPWSNDDKKFVENWVNVAFYPTMYHPGVDWVEIAKLLGGQVEFRLEVLREEAGRLNLPEKLAAMSKEEARDLEMAGIREPTRQDMIHAIQEFLEALRYEMAKNSFVVIGHEAKAFLENDHLFEEDLSKIASDEINAEIKAAGNCMAANLKTAAAFHLMRVAEFGLRQLAQHRPALNQPALAHVLAAKRPIEEATWKMVYEAIDREIADRKKSNTITPSEAEFYSHLNIQIRQFQFAWRDPIMHARFDRPHEVDDMFDAVKKFMRELMAGGIPLK